MLDAFEVLLGREVGLRVSLIENLTRSLYGSHNWGMLQDRFDARCSMSTQKPMAVLVSYGMACG